MGGQISRRRFMRNTAAGAVVSSAVLTSGKAQSQQNMSRPNILFIMSDQLRYDCLGASGNSLIKTPNLDRLAQQSAFLSNAFVNAPVCVPSRASFFTGRYAHAHRNRVNYTPLDQRETLMQASLQKAGYKTVLVGKTHLYYAYPPTREEAGKTGFDAVELHDGSRGTDEWSDYVKWRIANDPKQEIYHRTVASRKRNDSPDENPFRSIISQEFCDTTWTGIRTREWLNRLAGEDAPFFLFSSFWKPHSPYEVPEPYDRMYNDIEIPLPPRVTLEEMHKLPLPVQRLALRGNNPPFDTDPETLQWIYRSYYGTVSHLDYEVGQILNTLKETGKLENTVIVFTSDHGDQLLEHGIMGKNVLYDASTHIPLMVCFPRKIKPGSHDVLVESIDVLPTLFEMIGLAIPENCQGTSLLPLLTGNEKDYREKEAVFCENIVPEVITSGQLDFEFKKGEGVKGILHPDAKSVRTRRWKYNYYPGHGAELFDLKADPREEHNLANDPAHAQIVNEMRERLLNWLITANEGEQIAPRWLI